jgi:hypothetical protein
MALHSSGVRISCDFFWSIDLERRIPTTKAQMDFGYSATWFFGTGTCGNSYGFYRILVGPIVQRPAKAHWRIRYGYGRIAVGVGVPSYSQPKKGAVRFNDPLPKKPKTIPISETRVGMHY